MSHPVPIGDRAERFIAKLPIDDDGQRRLRRLVSEATRLVTDADPDDLQAVIEGDRLAFITAHNQFLHVLRGERAGTIQVWARAEDIEAARAAGLPLTDPDGAVFRMFGWVQVAVGDIDHASMRALLEGAVHRARAQKTNAW